MKELEFNTLRVGDWLSKIANYALLPMNAKYSLNFKDINDLNNVRPLHIVSLACLIEKLIKHNNCEVDVKPCTISNHLLETLRFQYYWGAKGNENFVQSNDKTVLNLWRIIESETEVHSLRVLDYLKSNFFQHKDLSIVKVSLDEAFYNISGHANASNNAFVFIQYTQDRKKLHVAVCDFGIGIAKSVRDAEQNIHNDANALEKAMEYGFTTKSQSYNKGFGLGNMKDACTENDYLWIISNSGYLVANRNYIKTGELNYSFSGTLIFYELSLAHFDDEEIMSTFEW